MTTNNVLLWSGLAFLLIGLHISFQPVNSHTKSPMIIELETMLDQCKDAEECRAVKNVLARTLAQEH